MSDKPYIAELHDIGKIINWKAIGLQQCDKTGKLESEPHDFENCIGSEWGINFAKASWQGIFRKDERLRQHHWSSSFDWALVSLADWLAAGFGRSLPETKLEGESCYAKYCLWTGNFSSDLRLNQKHDLHDLINFVNAKTWQEIEQKYKSILYNRAETARPGLNISSLHAHSIIAGKFFRILKKLQLPQQLLQTSNPKDIKKAFSPIKLTALHMQVKFSQRPFRTRDLNIFEEKRKLLEKLSQLYADNILACFGNEIIALFSSQEDVNQLIQEVWEDGFQAYFKMTQNPISKFLDCGIQEILGNEERWEYNYTPLPPQEIQPPLCEGCQMAYGEKRWPAEFLMERDDLTPETKETLQQISWKNLRIEDIASADRFKLTEWLEEWAEEELCPRCFAIRKTAGSLTRLASWQSGIAAWVYITIDFNILIDTLKLLHQNYIKSMPQFIPDFKIDSNLNLNDLPVRYPLLLDFIESYQLFINELFGEIQNTFGNDDTERIDNELICLRFDTSDKVINLLTVYQKLTERYFPKFVKPDFQINCPIRLGISISSVKHPFFAHWRFLEHPKEEISIQLVGSGIANIKINQLGGILNTLDQSNRHTLHRLHEIAQTSKVLANLVLKDKYDRDSKKFEKLREILPLGLDFESLLILVNLAGG